jgi:hypothetical protein
MMKIQVLSVVLLVCASVFAQKPVPPIPPVLLGQNGRLAYTSDGHGSRVPDFSYCGYAGSEKPIPTVPVRVVVPNRPGDATQRIQAALDYVASLPMDANGFRGAVLLEKGRYEIAGSLYLRASGVVLRGSGMSQDGTILFAAGTDRETLIRVYGKNDCILGTASPVADALVPVNALTFSLVKASFNVGDQIRIQRPDTKEWIAATNMAEFGGGESSLGWKPGNQTIYWNRVVKAVSGNKITIDAPITTELDAQFGGGNVFLSTWKGRIQHCGIENLQLISDYDKSNPKDENHRWMAITLENIENAWVRRVTFRHFAGSAVYTLETASRVTVEDCQSYEPVSEIGGYRRNTFMNDGQLNLFQRLYAESGMHDFVVGRCAAGPNAFVECFSSLPYDFSGALGSWASGVLYDNVQVDAGALSFKNRGQDGQGAGWSAANSVFWQCQAALIECPKPLTAQNWAFGSWSQFQGDGSWTSSNDRVSPESLFYQQLAERIGTKPSWAGLMPEFGEASSSPSYAVAAALTQEAKYPALQLTEWMDSLIHCNPISLDAKDAKSIDHLKWPVVKAAAAAGKLAVLNGWVVRGNSVLIGNRRDINWWNGNTKPNFVGLPTCLPHLTRWVPGRTGRGFTDDLQELTDSMASQGIVATDYHYSLWYERRRDDHEHIRRLDGDVWAPFLEQPFARSGQGRAYDGLSQYDLTKWNTWYWNRLQTYADLADQKGLVLFNQNFFQHNIIEAAAHWADCPWRTANNINGTGFPEPVNYAGDKRIFFAEQFYDLSHAKRRELYRNYIRKCLDNFKGNNGVIQFIGHEYTGPKHFVEFWLDVIGEWEVENKTNALVALSCTKDVQDSILADPKYNRLVEIIDTKYWKYLPEGKMYAPPGGRSLAPRQHERLTKRKEDIVVGNLPSAKAAQAKTADEVMYWTVRDYRDAYPDKAVIYSSDVAWVGWPAFMAGGSVCGLPQALPAAFLQMASSLKPMDALAGQSDWLLGNPATGCILMTRGEKDIQLDLTSFTGRFSAQWLNPRDGQKIGSVLKINAGAPLKLTVPTNDAAVLWLYK